MITGINESKILTKHVSYKCEYKLHSRKCSWNQIWNNNKYQYVCKNLKNIVHGKNIIFGILLHVVVKMVNI